MRAIVLLFALTILVAVTLPAGASVLVFDMGAASSPVYPGARQVTVTDPGWVSTSGLKDHDASAAGNPIWTNALTQDCITGNAPNGFRFPAAKGKWYVYVISGVGANWDTQAQYWDFDVSIGRETWQCEFESPNYTSGIRFPHHIFTATSNGQIEVRLAPRSKWAISGIIAWQPEDGKAARELIDQIEQWAPKEELAKWKEDVRPPAGPAPALSAADRTRGFYIWHRHWATPIYPWTNPTADEISPTLRIFAAPGEYEPITFTVHPLRRIQRAEVKPGDLGPVPASAFDIRKVRYMKARPNYSDESRLYRIVPDVLEPWQGGPLPADENATFWLTVHVPDDAKPGVYRGTIAFAGDGKVAELPVQLRILGVTLKEDPDHTYGIYYDDPLDRALNAPDEASRKHWLRKSELEHADMVAHGTRNVTMDCWSPAADANGRFDMTEALRRLEGELDMAQRFGFQPPYVMSISSESVYEKYTKKRLANHLQGVQMPPEAFFTEMTAMVNAIEQERKRRSWPEFLYQPYDEPGSEPAVIEFTARLFKAVKAAGVRTYTTASPEKPAYQPLKPYVDIWCTQTFLPAHDTAVADMKARPGLEYWCYPNDISGENDHTPVAGARMTYGFGFWRSGFKRLIPWMYQAGSGDPLNYLDGRMMDFFVRPDFDGTPIPVGLWEGFREGYDDMRYIYSLERAIAIAQESQSESIRAEAATARKTLDVVWKAIPVLPQYQYQGFWSPDEMDVYRWMIAERLERLTKLVRP